MIASILYIILALLGIGFLVGTFLCGYAAYNGAFYKGALSKQMATVGFICPYCQQELQFLESPTTDFDCEHCSRTVHFDNGFPVPVRTIICQACRAEHRVASSVDRYICDKCNRPLQLNVTPDKAAAIIDAENDAMLQNYDVLLLASDRRHESELSFKLQNLMVVNLPDARRLLSTASNQTPLVVGHDLSQRKAEAIKRQLEELGATVSVRPTNAYQARRK